MLNLSKHLKAEQEKDRNKRPRPYNIKHVEINVNLGKSETTISPCNFMPHISWHFYCIESVRMILHAREYASVSTMMMVMAAVVVVLKSLVRRDDTKFIRLQLC